MTVKWQRQHILILTLLVFFTIVAYVVSYFILVFPLHNQVNQKELQVHTQQQILNQQVGEQGTGESTKLLSQLPIDSATDRLLLALNRIQDLSDTTIHQISVDSSVVTDKITSSLSDVSGTTYQLQVSSPNDKKMHQFVYELQNMNRLVNIKQLQFNHQGIADRFGFTVSFTTYYNPTLTGLKQEAPSFESD